MELARLRKQIVKLYWTHPTNAKGEGGRDLVEGKWPKTHLGQRIKSHIRSISIPRCIILPPVWRNGSDNDSGIISELSAWCWMLSVEWWVCPVTLYPGHKNSIKGWSKKNKAAWNFEILYIQNVELYEAQTSPVYLIRQFGEVSAF